MKDVAFIVIVLFMLVGGAEYLANSIAEALERAICSLLRC